MVQEQSMLERGRETELERKYTRQVNELVGPGK